MLNLDIGVTEHFGYILNADSIGQTDRCGVRVTGSVCCQILLNTAQIGNFFQITVHPLVADDRQAEVFLLTYRMVFVFF